MATVSPGPLAFSIEDLPGPAFLLEGPDGRVSNHNAAFAEWAGREDLFGVALGDLLPDDPGAARVWHDARATGAAEHYVERRGPDGESSFWSLRARRTPAGVLVCAGDLTPVAKAAQAVHAAERDYVAVAAHELRAPLSAIKAWASALDARRAPAGDAGLAADGLGVIARQVDRMNELLTDLVEAACAGAGALLASPEPVDVDALIQRALAASPHAARVDLVDVGAASAPVFVDPVQTEAVLCRVLGWVAARAPAGCITLAVEEQRDPARGAEVHVLVDDPGPEIPRAAESEVFGRSPRSRRRRGGLGLYLCQQILAANGGRIFREHIAPTGSHARVVLALPASPRPRPVGGPARVLVGEPDLSRLSRALAALRLEGHEASGASDGTRFFEALATEHDVVVVDLSMPGLSPPASAVLARIRAARAAPPAVIVLSPTTERAEALDGIERAGALAVLGRPLDWPHLVTLVGCAAAARRVPEP